MQIRFSVKAVTFLAFLNFSLWLFDSFELQKSKASMVESNFYGAFVWVWMQRITLPLVIFFRQDPFPPSKPTTQVSLDCDAG